MSPTRCDRPARARGMQHAVKSSVPVPAAQLSASCQRVPVLRPGGYFYFKFYRTPYIAVLAPGCSGIDGAASTALPVSCLMTRP